MDLKGISVVLKKSGMLVLGQLGLLQLMYPNSNTHHPSFQKLLCWLGLLWFHLLFHCIAHQHQHNIMVNIALSVMNIFIQYFFNLQIYCLNIWFKFHKLLVKLHISYHHIWIMG